MKNKVCMRDPHFPSRRRAGDRGRSAARPRRCHRGPFPPQLPGALCEAPERCNRRSVPPFPDRAAPPLRTEYDAQVVRQFRTARKRKFLVFVLETCHKSPPAPVFAKELVADVERSLGLHLKYLDIGFLQGVLPQLPGGITEVLEQGGRIGDF